MWMFSKLSKVFPSWKKWNNAEDDKMREINIEEINKVVNQTLPGASLLYRDVNLSKNFEKRYTLWQIIKEKWFVDSTYKHWWLITTHRYTIISNHMMDMSKFEHGTNWWLVVANKDSHFQVIDIYKKNWKTLITLLHLPDGSWKTFQWVLLDLNKLIDTPRQRFEEDLNSDPIPEVTTDEWLDRCKFPLWMDDDWNLFPIED